jgi:hypothetical protein
VAVAVSLGVSAPALGAAGAARGARPAAALPAVTLTAAQPAITAERFGREADIDPGIYVIARGAPLQFNLRKTGFAAPIRITRVIRGPGGSVREVPFPSSLAAGFQGLRNFAVLTVRDPAGKTVITRHLLFCPNAFDPQRTSPDSPPEPRFPNNGCPMMPFTRTTVWGIQRGWGEDLAESSGTGFRLAVGTYTMTETITAPFRKVLGLPAATSSATVTVKVINGQSGSAGERRHHVSRTLPRLPAVRTMTSPPRAALPDMVPLPSWGIRMEIKHEKNGHPAVDHIDFNSTVAISGNSKLDVQGFRSGTGPELHAFQYFFLHGKIIGRAPAGTMLFDNAPDEQEWHFQQFAQYRLLDASKTTAAAVLRPGRQLRAGHRSVGAGAAAAGLGGHLLPEPRRAELQRHQPAQRHLLRRGHREPGEGDSRDQHGQQHFAAEDHPGRDAGPPDPAGAAVYRRSARGLGLILGGKFRCTATADGRAASTWWGAPEQPRAGLVKEMPCEDLEGPWVSRPWRSRSAWGCPRQPWAQLGRRAGAGLPPGLRRACRRSP